MHDTHCHTFNGHTHDGHTNDGHTHDGHTHDSDDHDGHSPGLDGVSRPTPGAAAEMRPRGGPVMLDIGGDIGALIVGLGPEWLDTELHVRRPGTSGATIHTGVWPRSIGADDVIVAVFPELAAGPWAILAPDGQELAEVAIAGGEVATVELDQLAPRR